MTTVTAELHAKGLYQVSFDVEQLMHRSREEGKRFAFRLECEREIKTWTIILHYRTLYKELRPGQPVPAGWNLIDMTDLEDPS